jgi:hypothetical protein
MFQSSSILDRRSQGQYMFDFLELCSTTPAAHQPMLVLFFFFFFRQVLSQSVQIQYARNDQYINTSGLATPSGLLPLEMRNPFSATIFRDNGPRSAHCPSLLFFRPPAKHHMLSRVCCFRKLLNSVRLRNSRDTEVYTPLLHPLLAFLE